VCLGYTAESALEKLAPVLDDISDRNLKHIQKHLAAFQQLHPSLSLADVVSLGQHIASRPENLLGTPGGRVTVQAGHWFHTATWSDGAA
jgi:hypothetical protein